MSGAEKHVSIVVRFPLVVADYLDHVERVLANDGSGSGLDADTVDGLMIDVLRHPPMVQYDKPLVDAFIAQTGEDPRQMDGHGTEAWLRFRDYLVERGVLEPYLDYPETIAQLGAWLVPTREDAEAWRALDEEASRHRVTWHWVKGHSGHRENEIADQLANRGIDEL